MNKPEVDTKRVCNAVPFDWKADDYPEYGEPGQAGKLHERLLQFACPGCGRFGAIPCTPPPKQKESWMIKEGSLDDPTTLSLHPSIHCVGCCGWHGWLKDGVFGFEST
jgi:hypothetical protein